MERLKTRPDFLRAARGVRKVVPSVTLELCRTPEPRTKPEGVRVGFTASRKIGGAVERNRAKRRLREAARLLLPELASPGFDYVFVARGGVTTRPWPRLLDDVKSALIRLAADRDRPAT